MTQRIVVQAVCFLLCTSLLTTVRAAETADEHPGAALYTQYCGTCHDQAEVTRAPPLSTLKEMSAQTLRLALTEGVMQEQAKLVPRRELFTILDYLAKRESDSDAWLAGWMCAPDNREVDLAAPVGLSRVGVDYHSSRYLSADQAGLTGKQLGNLELAWVIGFPDTASLRSSPVIVGSTMFYSPVETGRVLAFDVKTPCIKWVYDGGTQFRSSISYGPIGDVAALIVADRRGQVHAINARTGVRLWKAEGRHSDNTIITGGPTLYKDKVIVPVSGSGVSRGVNPNYECCEEHGAVVALNAATGAQLWTYHTMPDATYTGKTSRIGVKLRGPSGAPIWSTPTIDEARGLAYVTTGENTSLPATDTSDSVLALDIETGKLRWKFQALANDVWIMSCRGDVESSGPNCPDPVDSVLKDFDFGAAAILVEGIAAGGSDMLLAGQKSGDVWALDPDTGRVIWNQRFGQGTALGGIHWGMATDGQRLFVPINDPMPARIGFEPEPGMNAVDIATGNVLWRTPTTPDCSDARKARHGTCSQAHGLSAIPLVVDNAVIAGAIDGRLYIFDAESGETIFQYDTLRDFETVNGVAARGGSIDSHSVFAGSGMLFVAAGYGSFRQPPGNVLLAFRPKATLRAAAR